MSRTKAQEVRRSQKKSFYLRHIAQCLTQLAIDEPSLISLYVSRVELSSDGGKCYVYLATLMGQDSDEQLKIFETARERLVLYKPSMRKALADAMHARYVPDLRFRYDATKEKERRVNNLLTQVGDDLSEE